MALSAYEDQVLEELETQFQGDCVPEPRGCTRLAWSAVCVLAGVALVVAAHHAGLAIRLSDFSGFTTASVASAFRLTGSALVLAAAFLLGRAWDGARRRAQSP